MKGNKIMAKKKQTRVIFDPNIALCYIRQSVTRDGEDTNSPDR
jgi:hypothetical protein